MRYESEGRAQDGRYGRRLCGNSTIRTATCVILTADATSARIGC